MLSEIEDAINKDILERVGYGIYIENLDKWGDRSLLGDRFTFEFVNETGFPLSAEELEGIMEILRSHLGENFEYFFSSFFSPFESPHY